MPRPQKEGLDYFPLDTGFLSSDKRVRGLLRKYGTDGITFLISLWCDIYGGNGYYVLADEDYLEEASHELEINLNTIRQIVDYLLSRSLFDNTLFQSVKVLTAPGIQRRFQLAVKERVRKRKSPVIVEKTYWLLPEEEAETVSVKIGDTARCIKVIQFAVIPGNNPVSPWNNEVVPWKNATKESKGNKSKGNKREGEKLPRGENRLVFLADREIADLNVEYGEATVRDYIRRIDSHCRKHGRTYSDYGYVIREWIREDREKAGKKRESSRDRFHNFQQREYDWESVEEKIYGIDGKQGAEGNGSDPGTTE